MGLLNSALQIGRSALMGYQGALHVVGGNVSSAGSPDYTRLSPQLDPLQGPLISGDLQPGAGVALTAIQRNIDEALESRLRLAIGVDAAAAERSAAGAQIEALFDEFGGGGLGTPLAEFFHAFDELQNTPEDPSIRDLAITRGIQLVDSVRHVRSDLSALKDAIDGQIGDLVEQADGMAQEIGRLNEEISRTEAGRRGQATGLRDQRDALVRALGELLDVSVREQSNGAVNVYVGSETLVQGGTVRGLRAVTDIVDGEMRTSVRFADTNQQVVPGAGRLAGLIAARDQNVPTAALDELAAALINDVNRIHADGQGLSGFTTAAGTNDVLATDVPLDLAGAGLAFPPENGSFYITVTDDVTHTPVAHRIDVNLDGTDAGTTLESLVSDINAQVDGVTASITSDNRLNIEADAGLSFTFGYDGQAWRQDTSGVLAALGINTFFEGRDARDIAVNEGLVAQPSQLAAAAVYMPGDGSMAGRIAALDSAASQRLDGRSITDSYTRIVSRVALDTGGARDDAEAASTILSSLRAQRESISGVSLDEEAVSLLKFERAFQGAARFVTVVDDLLSELVQLIR